MKGIFKNSSFTERLFQFLFIFFLCFLGGIILSLIASDDGMGDVFPLKISVLIQSVFSFLIPPFLLAYLWCEKPLDFLCLKTESNWRVFVPVILMMIVVIPFVNLLADLNQKIHLPDFMAGIEKQIRLMEEQAAAQTEKMLFANTFGALLFNIFLIAVIPALGEELFFRGTLQRVISNAKGQVLAVWITAFIFSAVHMQFYGFIPRLLLGAFLGYLLVWSGSIWLPIAAHFVYNAFAVVFHYLSNKAYLTIDIDTIGTGNTWWLGLVCGVIFVCGFCFLRNILKKHKLIANN